MILIVDTNRIIAALIKDSYSRKIILSDKFELITVNFSKQEISKYKDHILQKAKISEQEFEILFKIIFSKIKVLNDILVEEFMEEAKGIMDKIDPNDAPFIAGALSIENNGVWSDDPDFEKQNKIKIWKTKDLAQFLG